jgi:hypothetical protein
MCHFGDLHLITFLPWTPSFAEEAPLVVFIAVLVEMNRDNSFQNGIPWIFNGWIKLRIVYHFQ